MSGVSLVMCFVGCLLACVAGRAVFVFTCLSSVVVWILLCVDVFVWSLDVYLNCFVASWSACLLICLLICLLTCLLASLLEERVDCS